MVNILNLVLDMKKLTSLFVAMLAVFTLTACNAPAPEGDAMMEKDGDAMMEESKDGEAMEKDGEAMEKDGEAMEEES